MLRSHDSRGIATMTCICMYILHEYSDGLYLPL